MYWITRLLWRAAPWSYAGLRATFRRPVQKGSHCHDAGNARSLTRRIPTLPSRVWCPPERKGGGGGVGSKVQWCVPCCESFCCTSGYNRCCQLTHVERAGRRVIPALGRSDVTCSWATVRADGCRVPGRVCAGAAVSRCADHTPTLPAALSQQQ